MGLLPCFRPTCSISSCARPARTVLLTHGAHCQYSCPRPHCESKLTPPRPVTSIWTHSSDLSLSSTTSMRAWVLLPWSSGTRAACVVGLPPPPAISAGVATGHLRLHPRGYMYVDEGPPLILPSCARVGQRPHPIPAPTVDSSMMTSFGSSFALRESKATLNSMD